MLTQSISTSTISIILHTKYKQTYRHNVFSEEAAPKALDRVTEKWEDDYPNAMKSWYKNWDAIRIGAKYY